MASRVSSASTFGCDSFIFATASRGIVNDASHSKCQLKPEAIAIASCGPNPPTYKHLYNQINNVAAQLTLRTAGRNDRVALVLPPLIIALLLMVC